MSLDLVSLVDSIPGTLQEVRLESITEIVGPAFVECETKVGVLVSFVMASVAIPDQIVIEVSDVAVDRVAQSMAKLVVKRAEVFLYAGPMNRVPGGKGTTEGKYYRDLNSHFAS